MMDDAQRMEANRAELIERILRATADRELFEPLDGLWLGRVSAPTELGHGVTTLSFCAVAQGSKEIWIGGKCYRYDPAHYLIATETLPIAGRIIEASPECPFLGLVLQIDPVLVGSVIIETARPTTRRQVPVRAVAVNPLDPDLLDAVIRLVRLIDTPDDARVLRPLIMREIIYRLLIGKQGDQLRHFASTGAGTQPIHRAIARLRENFDRPLRIEELAREVGMSTSSLHHHFKEVTALSPLQFQKHLRLQEARRLMLSEPLDATTAGYRVGYDDPAYFNRDYKRLFGAPPMRDVSQLRGTVTNGINI